MITFHHGAPGSGKSHNVMKYEVLPALKAGRSVFTNIDGVDQCRDAIADYVGRSRSEIDDLLTVFPENGVAIIGTGEQSVEITIRRNLHELVRLGSDETQGDLIVIDEAASPEIFDSDNRSRRTGISVDVLRFFQMHRHYGVDIVLLAQHPSHVYPKIRKLCVDYVGYTKLTGLKKDSYRVEHWTGGYSSGSGGMCVRTGFEKYDRKVFRCYQSVSLGNATEGGTNDNRFSLWKSWPFRAFVLGVCFLFVVVPYLVSSIADGSFFGTDRASVSSALESAPSAPVSSAPVVVDPYAFKPADSGQSSLLSYLDKFRLRLDAIVTHKGHPLVLFGLYDSAGKYVDELTSDGLANLGAVFRPFWYDSRYIEFDLAGRTFLVFSWLKDHPKPAPSPSSSGNALDGVVPSIL